MRGVGCLRLAEYVNLPTGRANDEGVSLNQLVVALLAGGIERRELVAELHPDARILQVS